MSDQPTSAPVPAWKQAAYDALGAAKEKDRQIKVEQSRRDGETLVNCIRKTLPEIADDLIDGFAPPSNQMIVDGYVFRSRFSDYGPQLILGKVSPDGSILFAQCPSIIANLATLAAEMEELDTLYAQKTFEEVIKPEEAELDSLLLTEATQTALSMMATLCQRVAKGQTLSPEQELVLAMVKYTAAKQRAAPVDDVSDIPF